MADHQCSSTCFKGSSCCIQSCGMFNLFCQCSHASIKSGFVIQQINTFNKGSQTAKGIVSLQYAYDKGSAGEIVISSFLITRPSSVTKSCPFFIRRNSYEVGIEYFTMQSLIIFLSAGLFPEKESIGFYPVLKREGCYRNILIFIYFERILAFQGNEINFKIQVNVKIPEM